MRNQDDLFCKAKRLILTLRKAGFQAVIAGGAVRDMLRKQPFNDIDIATNATPDQVESVFHKTIFVGQGKEHGVTIVVCEGEDFEVATFRKDGKSSDGRHADSVEFCSMKEDALRRDFTINGMFLDPIGKEVIDFVGGQQDLANGIVRFIGKSEDRITEDKLRMLRAVRFAVRFDFKLDKEAQNAIRRNSFRLSSVSPERQLTELIKMLRLGKPRRVMGLLFDTLLVDSLMPELRLLKGCTQPVRFHPEGDVLEHTIKALEALRSPSDELLLATLLHDIGKPFTKVRSDRLRFNGHDAVGAEVSRRILGRLKCSNIMKDQVVELVGNHMRMASVQRMKKSTLKRLMILPFFVEDHMELHRADCLSSHEKLDNIDFLEAKFEEFSSEEDTLRPARIFTGKDLIDLGFVPGKLFKDILFSVETVQLDIPSVTKEELINFVLRNFGIRR